MTTESIDHATLCQLVHSGDIRTAQVVSQHGGWSVRVICGESGVKQLAAQRSKQVRLFKKLETLAVYLKGLGLMNFAVDAHMFEPGAAKTHTRPDRAQALKQAHAAAAYEQWFRHQVQSSMDDPRPSVPDDEARAMFTAKKASLRAAAEADS